MWSFTSNILAVAAYSLGVWAVSLIIFMTAFHSEVTPDGPLQPDYDYLIVGAGTAGTVILSEMPAENSVLVVEAGPMTTDFLDIPIISPILQRSSFDWSYQTVSQENACHAMTGKRCQWPAGRGFGGSNILNNMIYYRGDPNDYRGWFNDARNYNYERDILPLFVELERGLYIGTLRYRSKFGEAFDRFDPSEVAANTTFQQPLVTQRNGFRWTMAHSARHRLRPNHHLLVNAVALKIVFDQTKRTHALGLHIDKNGLTYEIHAKKGIILTAGAIGTPKLLLQSGIGSCKELRNLSISCRLNLPAVGENLQDHVATGLDLITLNATLGLRLYDLMRPKNIYDFFTNDGRSPWSTIGCEALGFVPSRSGRHHSLPEMGFLAMPLGISTDSGVCLRHNFNINDRTWSKYFSRLTSDQIASILPIVLHPKSRGWVKLASNNPEQPPIINPRYLSDTNDARTLVAGIRLIQRFVEHEALKKLGARITPLLFPGCEIYPFDSTDYWMCYVRHLTLTVYHPAGTCRLGVPDDPETVVRRDDFLVNGIDNLYVADASIMPNLPSGNPNAAVALIAKQFMRVLAAQEDRRNRERKKVAMEPTLNRSPRPRSPADGNKIEL